MEQPWSWLSQVRIELGLWQSRAHLGIEYGWQPVWERGGSWEDDWSQGMKGPDF
jgi:hypothetical protein